MKSVIGAGLLGALVLIVWTFVVNGLLGFQSRIDMKRIPEERQVYEVLQEHIEAPGRYVFNPEVTEDRPFPGSEPVFSVLYSGIGHESAGALMWIGLVAFFLAPIIAVWMLVQTSDRVKSSLARKVLFFAAIGLLLALLGDLPRFGIGGYPFKDAAAYMVNHVAVWILIGLAVASRIQPAKESA